MTRLDITLPESLKSFVEEQVTSRGYGTASEYIQELIHEDKEHQEIEAKLLEALDEEPSEMTAADWEGLRKRVAQAGRGQDA
jgi:antitoxin ParD1/3/4